MDGEPRDDSNGRQSDQPSNDAIVDSFLGRDSDVVDEGDDHLGGISKGLKNAPKKGPKKGVLKRIYVLEDLYCQLKKFIELPPGQPR